MLTLKAPLELKCNPAMISSQEAFYHRITGNYGLLSAGIEKEDLLHAVTAPPELYIEEGGMTSIVQNTGIRNSHETRLEIINNLINRIAVMEEVHLTYQDRVYITDVLQKLGVREVGRFMKEVFRLKQETRSTEQLISLYWNHLEELTRQVTAYQSREREKETVRLEQEKERPVFTLHEAVMNRLQTGAVYQILNNFQARHYGNSRFVTRQEFQLTEQKRAAVQILLHQLRREVRGEKLPLIYRHYSYYGQGEPAEGVSMEEQINSRITSAVLLNLVDNLYLSRFERQQNRADTWLSVEHALYQSAENTLYRLKTGFDTLWKTEKEQHLRTDRQQRERMQEIHFVRALLTAGREAEDRFAVFWNRYGEASVSLLEEWHQTAEIRYLQGEAPESAEALPEAQRAREEAEPLPESGRSREKDGEEIPVFDRQEGSGSADGRSLPAEKSLPAEVREPFSAEKAAARALEMQAASKTVREEPLPAEIRLRTQPAPEEIRESNRLAEADLQWVQEGQERLAVIIERYLQASAVRAAEAEERIVVMERSGEQQAFPVPEPENSSAQPAAEKEADGRLEAAKTVLLKWQGKDQEAEPSAENPPVVRTEERERNVPGSAREVIREASASPGEPGVVTQAGRTDIRTDIRWTGEEASSPNAGGAPPLPPGEEEESQEILMQQILQINRQNIASLGIYRELRRQMEQEQKKKAPAGRDMRRDSLKALHNPERLLEEYEEEAKERKLQEQKQAGRMLELLPEQTRRVYEKLEQYLSTSGQEAKGVQPAADPLAMLLGDIRTAEMTHKETEYRESREVRQLQETSETLLERWKEASVSESAAADLSREEQSETRVSLIHKSTEQRMDQELLEQLLEQKRMTKDKTAVITQETREQELVRKTVHQQTRQEVREENEDLTELIQRGVQRQIGALSEQIYARLEKRLQNEKKRRGY